MLQRPTAWTPATATAAVDTFELGHIPTNTPEERLSAWQFLVDTGHVWKLPGVFGRAAQVLLQQGKITMAEKPPVFERRESLNV